MFQPEAVDPDWQRLESLYAAALELPASERPAYLERACAGNPALRRELDELLALGPAAERFFDRFGDAVRAASLDTPLPPHDPLIGAQLGRYRVEARLGVGGMGVVYRAQDAQLGRRVALKLLAPHLAADPEARRRFFTEARAAAALDHPNICTVFEAGDEGSAVPYIAMAYCEGETLKARIARGPVGPQDAALLALQMARGLAAAHARGIIHRDVKPANVIVGPDGLVKLVDFGLARLADVTVTAPAAARGTFAYMAPEQLRGNFADARTDLWALGVVLYEMLAGARPFQADSDAALLYAIAHQRPEPLEQARAGVPEPLAAVVERLLHEDPESRYGSAAELIADLERIVVPSGATPLSGADAPRAAKRTRGRLPMSWVVAAAGVAGAVALSLLLTRGDGATPAPAASAPASDDPRVAVLFFSDETPARNASLVTDALSDSLRSALAAVPGLHVPSRIATQPYRTREIPPAALADSLDAEWMVGGRLSQTGAGFEVMAELIDSTGRLVDFRRIEHSDEGLLLEDAVLAVAVMVREHIGRAVQDHRWQSGTNSEPARRLIEQAVQEIANANELSTSNQPLSAVAMLLRADSTLARATAADRDWAEPLIERGWVAWQLGRTAFRLLGPDSAHAALDRGMEHATAALLLGAETARAHEVRGELQNTKALLFAETIDSDTLRAWVQAAETDLRRAVEADRSLPRALNALSAIQQAKGEYAEARLLTEQAYRADYYFLSPEILRRRFMTEFEVGNDDQAALRCAEFRRRVPSDWFGAHCTLKLMTWSESTSPDVQTALRMVTAAIGATPLAIRATTEGPLRVLAAGVVARAVPGDSARHMLDRNLARWATDSTDGRDRRTLLVFEAEVRVRLGDTDRAVELVREYLQADPTARERLARSRVFGPLFSDSRLAAEGSR